MLDVVTLFLEDSVCKLEKMFKIYNDIDKEYLRMFEMNPKS